MSAPSLFTYTISMIKSEESRRRVVQHSRCDDGEEEDDDDEDRGGEGDVIRPSEPSATAAAGGQTEAAAGVATAGHEGRNQNGGNNDSRPASYRPPALMSPSNYTASVAETEGTRHSKPSVARASKRLIFAAILCLITWILLLIAFASPYWLSSYSYTYSPFVRLGLWDFCFNNYRHPPYQYDERFHGCHWVYSSKFQNIRDWLQPGWFIFVQAMMTIAFLLSLGSLISLSVILMYFFVRYQVIVMIIAFVLQAASAVPLFLAIVVFGIMAFDRSWLLYPSFNHFDWSFFIAIAALILAAFCSLILFSEARDARHRRKKMHNLVYNMQPRMTPTNGAQRAFTGPAGESKPLQSRHPSHQSIGRPGSVLQQQTQQPSYHHQPPPPPAPYFTTV